MPGYHHNFGLYCFIVLQPVMTDTDDCDTGGPQEVIVDKERDVAGPEGGDSLRVHSQND